MKKLIFTLLGAMATLMPANAQLQFEASPEFGGRFDDVIYDAHQGNRLYALSKAGNHLLLSTDNAQTWTVFYSFPHFMAKLSQLRQVNATTLSFIAWNTHAGLDGIYTFDLATASVTNQIISPSASFEPEKPTSYDMDATAQHILVNQTDLGFGTQGSTVYESNDGGLNWHVVYDSSAQGNFLVTKANYDPADLDRIFVLRTVGDSTGGVGGGLLVSEDAGQSWSQHLEGLVLNSIGFHPDHNGEILIGTGNSSGSHAEYLFKSIDGGQNWTEIPMDWNVTWAFNSINAIAYDKEDPMHVALVEEDQIAVSHDGGQTWNNPIIELDETLGYYSGHNLSFNAANPLEMVTTTNNYSQITHDGGATYQRLQSRFYETTTLNTVKYDGVDHAFFGVRGGLSHKNLASAEFTGSGINPVYNFSSSRIYPVADPNVSGRVFEFSTNEFSGGGLAVSYDYGQTKTQLFYGYADDMRALEISPSNPEVIYVSLRYGETSKVYKVDFSDMDHIVLTEIKLPGYDESFGVNLVVVTGIHADAVSGTLYMVGGNYCYKSQDEGVTWAVQSNGLPVEGNVIFDLAVNPFAPSEMAIASLGGVFLTEDAGENWHFSKSGNMGAVGFSDVDNGLLVAQQRYQSSLSYSADHGNAWTTIAASQTGYLEVNACDFLYAPAKIQVYFATNDLGLVRYDISDIQLGIENPQQSQDLVLYPNPTSGKVQVSGLEGQSVESIAIYSISGQLLQQTNETAFDLSGLSTGIYIVKVTTDKSTLSRSLVKK